MWKGIAHLDGHLNEPTVQNAVLAYARQLNAPFTLGEIWRPLHLPRTAVNRVLDRLHGKGVVRRWQVMLSSKSPLAQPGKLSAYYLYELVEPTE